MKNFSLFVSAIFHPLIIPTYCFAILFFGIDESNFLPFPLDLKYRFLFLLFLLTFAIPFSSILVLYYRKQISSLMMPDRKERILPFAYTTFLYTIFTYFFLTNHILISYYILGLMLAGVAASLALATIITYFWQISTHSIGIFGAMGFMLVLHILYPNAGFLDWFRLFTVWACLVMLSRLYLKAHDVWQLWAGGIVGFSVSFLMIFLNFEV
jgi:hypothetical protein